MNKREKRYMTMYAPGTDRETRKAFFDGMMHVLEAAQGFEILKFERTDYSVSMVLRAKSFEDLPAAEEKARA
jgi:hypothetical protein